MNISTPDVAAVARLPDPILPRFDHRSGPVGTVYLVGAGPGDPDLITVRGDRLLRSADVVCYDRLIHPDLLDRAPGDARRVYVGKRAEEASITQAEINALLVAEARRHETVVRLKGGDPFVFGRGGEEAHHLRGAAVPVEIVPGVTSATAAPASAGVPVTDRRFSSGFTVVTGHRVAGEDPTDWVERASAGTLVILMGLGRLSRIAERLVAGGLDPDTPTAVVGSASTEGQHVVRGRIDEIAPRSKKVRPPATVVIGEVVDLGDELRSVENEGAEPATDQLGRRLRDLRISVVDRCNFRCDYCMPAEVYGEGYQYLDREEYLDFDEIVRLARLFARRGVEKIRLTGGEPLLRPELEELIARLSRVEGVEDLALTTNGFLLADRARALADAGLDRVTVSLDALDPERFRELNGVGRDPEPVLRGIERAADAGLRPLKINTVVRRDVNEEAVLPLIRRFRGSGHTVRFIEFMDVGTRNDWSRDAVVPSAELKRRIEAEFPLEPLEENYPGEVADRYRFADGSGEIGFVSSITQPFCGSCTRARLSTDGSLYTCLFASEGTDFRSLLRSGAGDGALLERIDSVWSERSDRYSEERGEEPQAPETGDRIEMYAIGG